MAEAAAILVHGDAAHRFDLRVYWEDTDAAGIVYYANYLRFIERARSEMVRAAGIDQQALLAEQGVIFAVRRCEVDYLAPAKLEDRLTVVTAVAGVGAATIDLIQTVERDGTVLVDTRVRLACVGAKQRPTRLPKPVRAVFATLYSASKED